MRCCLSLTINFFSLYFLFKDFSLNIVYLILKLFKDVKNITLEGTVTQILYLDPSFYFIWKIRETFSASFKHFFLDFIKQKLGRVRESKALFPQSKHYLPV